MQTSSTVLIVQIFARSGLVLAFNLHKVATREIKMRNTTAMAVFLLFWMAGYAASQTQQQSTEKKPVMETPSMRLASARNVMVMRKHGSQIPADVIRSTVEGWDRFTLVETSDKADLIIEVWSSGDSSVQVSSSSKVSPENGQEEKSTTSTKDFSPTDVKMTVIDARNKRPLWTSTESVKFAMKEKAKENNLVEAAERLATKFHDRLEPRQSQ
jgi:hypothetical protein